MVARRTVSVDPTVGACYIQLADMPVARTEEVTPDVLVDLDQFGVAVGIEVLDLRAHVPVTDLCRQLHVRTEDEPFLAKLLPTLEYSLRFPISSASDSVILARSTSPTLLPA